jgi:hypothetical protein
MPIHTRVQCDLAGCDQGQSAQFDALHETYGNLIDALREGGWRIEFDGAEAKTFCPKHAAQAPTEPSVG